jgi:hypothetical protein
MTSRQKNSVNQDLVAERHAQRLSIRSSEVVRGGQLSRLCSWMTIIVWNVASCRVSVNKFSGYLWKLAQIRYHLTPGPGE